MQIKKYILLSLAFMAAAGNAEAKKILGHDDFDSWQKLTNYAVSADGRWAACAVNPQEGDGMFILYDTSTGKRIEIPRGYSPVFTADSKWAVVKVRPVFSVMREARIKKKKNFELPQDSLAIVNLEKRTVEKIGNVISFKTGEKGGEWVAWQSCDTTLISPSALKDKNAGRPLVIRSLPGGTSKVVNWVNHYVFSKDGSRLALTLKKQAKDSTAADGAGMVALPDTAFHLFDRDKAFYGKPVFDEAGKKLAYVASADTAETGTRKAELYLIGDLDRQMLTPEKIDLAFKGKRNHYARPVAYGGKEQERLDREWREKEGRGEEVELMVNQYSVPEFSENGSRLVIGVAPYVAPDDTAIVDFETPALDIWRWDAPLTPPQELKNLEKLRRTTFPAVVDPAHGTKILLTSSPLVSVSAPDKWNGNWALLADKSENIISSQWDYQYPVNLSLKNVDNGKEIRIGEVPEESYSFSPGARYVVWFENGAYHSYSVADGKTVKIGSDIEFPLWDEDTEVPYKNAYPYGIAGWTENDGRLLVCDRFDIWAVDPSGNDASYCLTKGEGRRKGLRMRIVDTDKEKRWISKGDDILYSLFDYADKRNGLASQTFTYKPAVPSIDFLDGYTFTQIKKGKNAGVCSWVQGNFSTSPNLYVSRDIRKGKSVRVTDTNPQMKEYNWGTAQLVRWTAYDGKPSEGILYLPEDFDPEKEYPMLCYFYETYSGDLYRHFDMEPSWSWINFPFYVSRGYVIFVPDIHYVAGVPGECAYNYVCSGVDAVCGKYPNIDRKRIGIDGQSWGGYQTAYLVTRTDMFACAGSGAPVSNMTSAYGGIRWGTGSSRQGQYEQGQSRIGRSLWEAPELYIANSPVFHADRVNTPLLIMHNDDDGAVPWYQGIELFMALRRLGKPVWMLQYNGEAHNLVERRNRKDITKRLQQFFDHYLKGAPMPEWMLNGIPAVRKGQEFGY